MNKIALKLNGTKTAILLGLILCLSPFVQAQAATKANAPASTPAQTIVPPPAFDHTKTGFLLRDVHTTLRCEQCHVDGIFKNTPKDCAGCHSAGTRVGATPKPVNHVQTTQACDICHTSPTSFLVKSFKHAGIVSGCVSCHNNQSLGVVSKPVSHFSTSQPCELCHTNTNTFVAWKMDHTGITGGCATCHQGQYPHVVSLPPIPSAHVPVQAGQDCSSCHSLTNFTNFLGATYNHAGITTGCSLCHSGQMPGVMSVPPIPAKHVTIQPGQECNACHSSTEIGGFLGALYSHAGVLTGSCDTCHTGAYPGVKTKSSTHIPTSSSKCDACHTAINTSGYTSFLSAQYHALNNAPAGGCASCHNGTYTSTASAYGVASAAGGHIAVGSTSCDTCHTASNTVSYTSFTGATYHASQSAAAGGCATCHTGSITTLSATGVYPQGMAQALTLSGVSHPVTAAACDTCHTSATTANFTTFLGAIFNHASVSGGVTGICHTCHDGTKAKGKGTTHMPTAALPAGECDACHTQTNTANYTTFLGAGYHATTTTLPAGGCAQALCHDGSGTGGALGKPSPHPGAAVTACDSAGGCHIPSTTASFSTWLGAKYHPSGAITPLGTVALGSCGSAGCHDGTGTVYNAQGTASSPTTHVTTTAACDSCHSNTLSYTTWLGATFDHTGIAAGTCATCHNGVQASGQASPHIPATGSCDAVGCHAGATVISTSNVAKGYPSAWGGLYTYNHTGVVAGSCATCHGGTYPGVSSKTFDLHDPVPAGFVHQVTTAPCDQCHTSVNTGGYTTWTGAGYAHSAADATKCATSGCHAPGGAGKGITANHIPVYSNSCDASGCHAIPGTLSFAGGNMAHTLYTSYTCTSCHSGTYTTFGTTGAVVKVSTHIPTTITGTLDCNTCHKGTPPNTAAASTGGATVWATGEKMNHNSAQGMGGGGVYCVTCHLSGATYLGKMSKKSHNGSSTSKDCSSTSCHKPLGSKGTAYSSWGG